MEGPHTVDVLVLADATGSATDLAKQVGEVWPLLLATVLMAVLFCGGMFLLVRWLYSKAYATWTDRVTDLNEEVRDLRDRLRKKGR